MAAVVLGGAAVVLLMTVSFSRLSLTADDGLEEKYHSLEKGGSDKVAIITIEGTILDGEGFVKKQIDRVRKDDDVKAVVVRVDSPGGTVTGSDYILHHLNKLREEREPADGREHGRHGGQRRLLRLDVRGRHAGHASSPSRRPGPARSA